MDAKETSTETPDETSQSRDGNNPVSQELESCSLVQNGPGLPPLPATVEPCIAEPLEIEVGHIPSSPEHIVITITDSDEADDDKVGTRDAKRTSSSSISSFLSTSDTTSSEDEAPAAKRRRSLEESKTVQQLFEQKWAVMSASNVNALVGTSVGLSTANTSHASGNPDHNNIVRCSSFDPTTTANACTATETVPAQSTKDLFLDISDVTSLSSVSISSNEIRSLGEHTRRTRNGNDRRRSQSDWMSPHSSDDWDSPVSPPPFDVEFEVASVSIYSSNPIEDANSSSGLEDEGFGNFHMKDTDSSDFTDETENDADEEWEKEKSDDDENENESVKNVGVGGVSDSELSDKDFWHCTQCNAKTNSPYLRYCLRCFRIRRNWLPKRPQPKNIGKKLAKRNRNRSRNRRHTSSDEEEREVVPAQLDPICGAPRNELSLVPLVSLPRSTSALSALNSFRTPQPGDSDVVDSSSGPKSSATSGPSSGSSSARPASSAYSNTSTEGTYDWDCTDGPRPKDSSSTTMPPPAPAPQSDTVSAQLLKEVLTRKPIKIKAMRKSTSCSEEKEAPLCSVCMVRDKDAAFVHGKTAHVYSCYNCADKILKKNGKCPICRKRILRVVKVINS